MRHLSLLHGRRGWLAALAVVTLLSLLAVFAAPGQAADEPAPVLDAPGAVGAQSQVFNDDLTVEPGQVLEGDVVVYDGDVRVEGDGLIRGNLVVYSGDIAVESGGTVEGDITSFSGDVDIEGRITGSISSWSGDVSLGDEAFVGGDVSVMSGDIGRARGAVVEGNIVRGPGLKLPAMAPQVPGFVNAPQAPQPMSPMTQVFGFFGRLLWAIFLLGLAVLVGAGLLLWKPGWVEDVRTTLHRQTALSFAVGILVNVLALAVIGILWLLVCTRPPALLMGLALLGLNLAGLAAVGDEIGRRVEARLGRTYSPAVRMALGLLVPGVVLAVLYVFGFCFQFFAFVGLLVLASFGAGAVLVKLLNLGAPAPTPATAPAPVDVAERAETLKAAGAAAAPVAGEVMVSPAPESQTTTPVASDLDVPAAASPAGAALVVEEITTTATESPAAAEPAPESSRSAAEVPTIPEVAPSPAPAAPDDFTRIVGIGPTFNQRLQAAGIRTFAELASKSPEEIAAVIGWSKERVVRDQIVEQARKLAG